MLPAPWLHEPHPESQYAAAAGRSCTLSARPIGEANVRGESAMTGRSAPEQHRFRDRFVELRYLLWLPRGYEAGDAGRWPLLLFLHGAGERGADLSRVMTQGLARELAEGLELPLIAVAPQCAVDRRWQPEQLLALLDELESRYRVDGEREYVTGMSMGGYGTWALALARPERFAAIAPVCGGGDPRRIATLRHLPVWAFHGALDDIVPLAAGEQMVDALRRAGGNVRFIVYPDAGHDSWTPAYREPELYVWLLAQRRAGTASDR
jgi:predicted peptidase